MRNSKIWPICGTGPKPNEEASKNIKMTYHRLENSQIKGNKEDSKGANPLPT